jgi:AraC-like DNA-binding protein
MTKVAVGLVNMFCGGLAEHYGLPRAHSLAAIGLSEQSLSDPDGLVEMSALVALLRFGQTQTRDPALGLTLARTWDLRQQGFWGYALLSSSSMRERLDGHVRYQPLRSPLELTLSEAGGAVTLHVVPHGLPGDVLRTFIDWAIATSLMHLREQLGRKPSELKLSLCYPRQPYHSGLQALFGGELEFDAPCTRLRFPAQMLEKRLQGGDPYLQQLARAQLDARLDQAEAERTPELLVEQVRERIAVLLDHDASLTRVARELGLGPRTLQRQLDAQLTSFQALVEDVRRGHALRAMRETQQSVTKLAARLGYADPASFRRAFRRWTGQSPAGYRAAQRGVPLPPLTQDDRPRARKVSGA